MANYEKYLNINWINLNKMTAENLRDVIKILSPVAQRNLKALGKSAVGQLSPSYQTAISRGKAFGVSGIKKNDVNALRNEYSDINKFLSSRTSTLSGFKKFRQETFQRINPRGGKKSPFKDLEEERLYWRIYNKVKDDGLAVYDSTRLQKETRKIFKNKSSVIKKINAQRMNYELAKDIYTANNLSLTEDEYNLPAGQYKKLIQKKALEYLNEHQIIIDEQMNLLDIDDSEDGLVTLMLNRIGADYEHTQAEMYGDSDFI